MEGSTHRLATVLGEKIEQLEVPFHEAYWESQIEASPDSEARRIELELELRKVKGDAAAFEDVRAALHEPLHDPLVRRQLEVLRSSLTGNQMSDSTREEIVRISGAVEGDFAAFRPEVAGKRLTDNQIDEVLQSSNDSDERRGVWKASKEIGEIVADRVRELARLRNDAARALGFADYYGMELELQEIPEDWLFDTIGQIEVSTADSFDTWKAKLDEGLRARFAVSDLYPWHYADPFFQALPPDGRVDLDPILVGTSAEGLAAKTFSSWGIDISSVLERSDLYPRERKCQHAFCLSVDRLDDVRILANVVPGERWTDVMLHEFGHAAYDIRIDQNLPYLLRRPAHTFVTEAMALLSGRLVRDVDWLGGVAGIEPERLSGLQHELEAATAAASMLFARWCLVMIHFERDLYADPEGDLDARWWELVERFQGVRLPVEEAPTGAWAAKIHISVAPVYYHNYLLGEVLASQLRGTIEEEAGGFVGSERAGAILVDRLFRPGASLRWDDLIHRVTGSPLDPGYFAKFLNG